MSTLDILLSFLLSLMPAMILIFCLIVVFSILLFSSSLTLVETKAVTMEIVPDYNVLLKISQKDQSLTGIALKVCPSVNARHINAKVTIRDDALENISLNEQSCILTREQLNDSCMLMTHSNQNEQTVQNLQLTDAWIILQTFSDTSQEADDSGSTDTNAKRKTKKKAKACPKKKKAKKSEPAPLPS